METTFNTFQNPPTEFGIIPLWFWNDDLEDAELIRQLHEFHRAGFGGIVPHPRVGLSPKIGYLTNEYFRLIRLVVAECAKLEMKVILYDEGCYPSGSANGAVIKENPEFASQCIGLVEKEITGPWSGYWKADSQSRSLMDKHVCSVIGRLKADGKIDTSTLRLLEVEAHDILRIDVPEGNWKVMSVWNVCSAGHIRGVLADEETGHATAPPSGDILNPEAVSCFLRLTHDQYYKHLREYFGSTVIAMFTDEPGPMGRGPHRFENAKPFTPGFVEWLETEWESDPRTWLPSLWIEYDQGTEEFRQRYTKAVHDRQRIVFYGAQSKWCSDHGIAFTGHPSNGNEMTALSVFQIPGQDVVWREILPNSPSAIEGVQSVTAKAATSGARLYQRERILTEIGGAYGWRMTCSELKWLYDWHLVRGNNLINAHAVFYSIRGRRAWESEPDIGVHNVWWPHFHHIAQYSKRLCWLLSNGKHICDLAILGDGNALPWAAAKVLYQKQIDFLYIDDLSVSTAELQNSSISIGNQCYNTIIIDGDPVLSEETENKLKQFQKDGGDIIHFANPEQLLEKLSSTNTPDIILEPSHNDLRFIHIQKEGLDFYLLINEGENQIEGNLKLQIKGSLEYWNPLTGEREPCPAQESEDGILVHLKLGHRESRLLVVDPNSFFYPITPEKKSRKPLPLKTTWTVQTEDYHPVNIPAPADWAQCKGFELFTGTLVYRASIEVPSEVTNASIDLGQVGDIAEVFLNGESKGVRMWAPYCFHLGNELQAGPLQLEIRITNSMANEYNGAQMPSGLIGPVELLF